MDFKILEIVDVLRMYFFYIFDFRYMLGFKIKIFCFLRFKFELFNRVWGELDVCFVMYVIVFKFLFFVLYGFILLYYISFFFGELFSNNISNSGFLDIVFIEIFLSEKLVLMLLVIIELELREFVLGFVDVCFDANVENGLVIYGKF